MGDIKAFADSLEDPELAEVIKNLRANRLLREADEDLQEFLGEPDGAEESRSIDRANAKAINRRID